MERRTKKAPLARNAMGRRIYFVLVAVALALAGAAIWFAGQSPGEHDRNVLFVVSLYTTLGLLWMVVIAQCSSIYRLRAMNVLLFCVISLGTLLILAKSLRPAFAFAGLTNALVAASGTFYGALAALLLPSSHSDLAHRVHPFVHASVADSLREPRGDSPTAALRAIEEQSQRAAAGVGNMGGGSPTEGRARAMAEGINRALSGGAAHYATADGGVVPSVESWPEAVPFSAHSTHAFKATSEAELSFAKGDALTILDCRGKWWRARHGQPGDTSGPIGFVPRNFIMVDLQVMTSRAYVGGAHDEVTVGEGVTVEVMEVHELMSLVRTPDGSIGSMATSSLAIDVSLIPRRPAMLPPAAL